MSQANAVNTADLNATHLVTVCDAAVAFVAVVDAEGDVTTTRAALRTAVNNALSTDPIGAPA